MPKADGVGAEIMYFDEGVPSGPVLLLIMGLGGSADEWGEPFVDRLRSRFRVLRFHHRGVGPSTNTLPEFTLDTLAEDAIAVLDAASVERADVLGFSMGGMVAQLLSLDHPGRVRRLVLLSTHFGGSEVTPPTERVRPLFEPRTPGSSLLEHYTRLGCALSAPGFAEQNGHLVEFFAQARTRYPLSLAVYRSQLSAILTSDRSQRIRDVVIPTLVIHGEQDALIPVDNGRALADRMPNAELIVLPDCGHLPTWERPTQVCAELERFLSV